MTTTRLNRLFPRCRPVLLCAAVVTFAGCAHAPRQSGANPAQEAAAVTATTSNPVVDNPALTAEEIGKRFLKLIEGLESRSDLSVEGTQDALGVPLKQLDTAPESASFYGQPLGDGWNFGVKYLPESPSNLRGISLDFGKPGERFAPLPAAICALDFDYYHNALRAMGFRAVEVRGEIGQLEFWRYYKEDVALSILPQNIVPGEAGRLCVKSIGTLN